MTAIISIKSHADMPDTEIKLYNVDSENDALVKMYQALRGEYTLEFIKANIELEDLELNEYLNNDALEAEATGN